MAHDLFLLQLRAERTQASLQSNNATGLLLEYCLQLVHIHVDCAAWLVHLWYTYTTKHVIEIAIGGTAWLGLYAISVDRQ